MWELAKYITKQEIISISYTTKEGKSKVVRREPFTIRLLYEPETDVVQECYCGVDTGSKHVGVAVIGNDRVLYQSQTELRSDIKKKMDRRRAFRKK